MGQIEKTILDEISKHEETIKEFKRSIKFWEIDIKKYQNKINKNEDVESQYRLMADVSSNIVKYYDNIREIESLILLKKSLFNSIEGFDFNFEIEPKKG